MPIRGFHSEWVTIKDHRVLLECRASYPDATIRFIARVAIETCDNNSLGRARVVKVDYDDKSCCWNITVATTEHKDKKLENLLMTVLHTMFANGNCQSTVVVVKEGDTYSDHFQHTEHLSVEAGVAVDRFRHSDSEYMETVTDPS